ncbi:glycolate oxidase [Agrilactobacillus composti DSM 18527 = JCM 14202]|uniref:Glycolate oxidase n=1 Tax=Agrilactobacillus composti DSM 18527 = JCM 14202 TaxID=1423734 RepID=X0PFF3_9LACO|nr:FAD-binding oxidoreductase [Agrilactobacillus composti]KRM32841.1 glycolate oxidase [Agrilactobacillus composti DSM 18527 = JCM 14202]GAF40649.1 glycolate dehydrogenase, subunit GlcD [Agrilactobacillus composti DSM 18527 = JCM 14202]
MESTKQIDILALLKDVLPKEQLLSGDEISEDYGHDEMGTYFHLPDLVVKAKSTEDVSAVMKVAYAQNIPVVVRGAGTGLVGGSIAVKGGILIDLSGMNQIKELDEDNLTLTVDPGVLLMDIKSFTEEKGFFYPPDPGEKSATIGGNISTNAGGMRAIKYGVTRDFIRALTVVAPNGDVMHLGGKVVKNSSGYDLKDLVIGSEGTLGIVTEATLKLIMLPTVTTSLLIPFESFEGAIKNVPVILRSGIVPTAMEFFENNSVKFWEIFTNKVFPEDNHTAYLLLSFDGQTTEEVEGAYEKVAEICLDNGAEDVYVLDDDGQRDTVWTARGAFLEAIKNSTTEMEEADVVVPRSKIVDFIQFTHDTSKSEAIRIPGFGHVGDGNLHFYICRDDLDDQTWQAKLNTVFDAMYAEGRKLGGQVSGEHGIGMAKRKYLNLALEDSTLNMMRAIKKAVDPNNILNPEKVI